MSDDEKQDKIVENELNRLKTVINHEQVGKIDGESFKWSDLTTKPVRKALTIGFVLVMLSNFSGVSAMLNYTANIFEEAGSSLHPNLSAIVVGAIQLFGTITATLIVDRVGRKVMIFKQINQFQNSINILLYFEYTIFFSIVIICCIKHWNNLRFNCIGNVCDAQIWRIFS